MTGAEVAKQLFLGTIILTVLAGGLMLMPDDARYLGATYCFATALALLAYVFLAKPGAAWARSTLRFLGGGMAIIGLILALGG